MFVETGKVSQAAGRLSAKTWQVAGKLIVAWWKFNGLRS